MTALYAIPLVIGVVALIVWVAAVAASAMAEGSSSFDPEAHFGLAGRIVVGALVGFGMTGISTLFAGWAAAITLVCAALGAVGLAAVAAALGPRTERA